MVIGTSLIFIYGNILSSPSCQSDRKVFLSRLVQLTALMVYCIINMFYLHVKIEDLIEEFSV